MALETHEHYLASQMEQAIGRVLTYGCVYLDGVRYYLHELTKEAEAAESEEIKPLDLTSRSEVDAIGNQPVDLARYQQLLKFSW